MSAATPGTGFQSYRAGHPRQNLRPHTSQFLNSAYFAGPVPPAWCSGPSTSQWSDSARSPRGSVITCARRKWYAIFEPEAYRGIYKVWEEVKQLVTGHPNAVHKGFPNEAAALEWMSHHYTRAQEENTALEHLRSMIRNQQQQYQRLGSSGERAALPAPVPAATQIGPSSLAATAIAAAADVASMAAATASPRPWETQPLLLDVPAEPTREYYRKWYAVRFVNGGRPGVYNTWQDASEAINERYAEYKSFSSHAEAVEYAFGAEYAKQLLPQPQQPSSSPSSPPVDASQQPFTHQGQQQSQHQEQQPYQQYQEQQQQQQMEHYPQQPQHQWMESQLGLQGQTHIGAWGAAIGAAVAAAADAGGQLSGPSPPGSSQLHHHHHHGWHDEQDGVPATVYGWADGEGRVGSTVLQEEEVERQAGDDTVFFSDVYPYSYPQPQPPLVHAASPSSSGCWAPALAAGDAAAVRPPPVNPGGGRRAGHCGGVSVAGGVGLPVSPAAVMSALPSYDVPYGRRAAAMVLPAAPAPASTAIVPSSPLSAAPPAIPAARSCAGGRPPSAAGAQSHHSAPAPALVGWLRPPCTAAAFAAAAVPSTCGDASSSVTGGGGGGGSAAWAQEALVEDDAAVSAVSGTGSWLGPAATATAMAAAASREQGPEQGRAAVVRMHRGRRARSAADIGPVAKRRGRPPKDAAVAPAEKRRGRPPKDAAVAPAEKRRGRPPKSAVAVTAPVAKRRGRPPKSVAVAAAPIAKRRGRSPKSAAAVAAPAEKRRGRPPKAAAGRSDAAASVVEAGCGDGAGGKEEQAPQRRRGRPAGARAAAAGEQSAAAAMVAAAKRPRGRPRRQPDAAILDAAEPKPDRRRSRSRSPPVTTNSCSGGKGDSGSEDAPKRPRGRPRKLQVAVPAPKVEIPDGWTLMVDRLNPHRRLKADQPYIMAYHVSELGQPQQQPSESDAGAGQLEPSAGSPASSSSASSSSSGVRMAYTVVMISRDDNTVVRMRTGVVECGHPAEAAVAAMEFCFKIAGLAHLSCHLVGTGLDSQHLQQHLQRQQRYRKGRSQQRMKRLGLQQPQRGQPWGVALLPEGPERDAALRLAVEAPELTARAQRAVQRLREEGVNGDFLSKLYIECSVELERLKRIEAGGDADADPDWPPTSEQVREEGEERPGGQADGGAGEREEEEDVDAKMLLLRRVCNELDCLGGSPEARRRRALALPWVETHVVDSLDPMTLRVLRDDHHERQRQRRRRRQRHLQ